jgi:uncharacterized membrane protein YsdA (DUF1294 family)
VARESLSKSRGSQIGKRAQSASQTGQWRTTDSSLHLLGIMCGWPGAMLAQKTLCHKTKKQSFQVVFWFTVMLNGGALVWLLSPSGARVFKWLAGTL